MIATSVIALSSVHPPVPVATWLDATAPGASLPWTVAVATHGPSVADVLRATGTRVIGCVDQILKVTQPQPTVVDAALSDLTLEQLDSEWKHEFCFEGLRRTTNIRFGTYFGPWWDKDAVPADRHTGIFPIPQAELDKNPNMKQNPGYGH